MSSDVTSLLHPAKYRYQILRPVTGHRHFAPCPSHTARGHELAGIRRTLSRHFKYRSIRTQDWHCSHNEYAPHTADADLVGVIVSLCGSVNRNFSVATASVKMVLPISQRIDPGFTSPFCLLRMPCFSTCPPYKMCGLGTWLAPSRGSSAGRAGWRFALWAGVSSCRNVPKYAVSHIYSRIVTRLNTTTNECVFTVLHINHAGMTRIGVKIIVSIFRSKLQLGHPQSQVGS